jgi:hypothetical protein
MFRTKEICRRRVLSYANGIHTTTELGALKGSQQEIETGVHKEGFQQNNIAQIYTNYLHSKAQN